MGIAWVLIHTNGSWSSIYIEGKVLTYSCQLP
jgi:hypothetical protein